MTVDAAYMGDRVVGAGDDAGADGGAEQDEDDADEQPGIPP